MKHSVIRDNGRVRFELTVQTADGPTNSLFGDPGTKAAAIAAVEVSADRLAQALSLVALDRQPLRLGGPA